MQNIKYQVKNYPIFLTKNEDATFLQIKENKIKFKGINFESKIYYSIVKNNKKRSY